MSDLRDRRDAVEREVASRLRAAGVPDPQVDARWLVDHVVEVAGGVTGQGERLLERLVARRAAREPLQLVIGRTWFRTLELVCAPGVFIPRPETEIVAGIAIDAARAAAAASDAGAVRVVDVCTGTGAVACSIAAEVSDAEVIAADRSPAAVEVARSNAARLRDGTAGDTLAPRAFVTVVTSDLLDDVDPSWRGHLDVLVSNPPYLPAGDRETWEPEVADHDPEDALVGGPDGHEVVDRLLRLAADWLAPGGTVVIEIDARRGDDARAAAQAAGLVDVRIAPDLTGRDRAVVARRAPAG